MADQEGIVMDGTVLDILAGGKYKIQLIDIDMVVEGYASGKMRKNSIKIIVWDTVKVELNPYEPKKWRILFRDKDKKLSKEMITKFDTLHSTHEEEKKEEEF